MKPKQEYKVIMMGDSGVGKTSIIQRFSTHTFDYSMETTIGASFISKVIPTQFGNATLNIWDTAGQEKYKSLLSTYSRGAQAAILVFDLTIPSSFQDINKWLDELYKYCKQEDVLLFLVGNKSDLEIAIPEASAEKWAKDHRCLYIRTSAENGKGIKELFDSVASLLLEKLPDIQQEGLPNIDHLTKQQKKSGCC